jgi:putative two-component system response regulator
MSGKKQEILLVDDDAIQIALLEDMLKTEYAVVSTRSGGEALEYLYGGSVPDLIVLDIVMPRMDGWETFNRMRSICALQNVPIIFLTSLGETQEAERARAMGASDYITKPVNANELMERIQNAIEKNRK